MEVLMKNFHLLAILDTIEAIGSGYKNAKFNYFLTKNDRKIRGELSIIDETLKPSPKFMEFEQERYKLCAEYSSKDDNGKPNTVNGQYDIQNKEEFDKKLKELKEDPKWVDIVKEREEQYAKYQEILQLDSDVQLHKIKIDDVPDELPKEQLDVFIDSELIIPD